MLGAGVLEQHRLGRGGDGGGEIGERDRLIVHFGFADLQEMLHEVAQPELVQRSGVLGFR